MVSHSGREQWPVLGYEQLDSLSQIFAAEGVQLFMKDLHYFHFQKTQTQGDIWWIGHRAVLLASSEELAVCPAGIVITHRVCDITGNGEGQRVPGQGLGYT